MYFQELESQLKKRGSLNVDHIKKAYELANEVHQGQKRKSGEDYIIHPYEVAKLLTEIGADEDVICAALLHDTVEDSKNRREIEKKIFDNFGDSVYFMVEAMSKDQEIVSKDKQHEEYLDQIKKAMEIDFSVFLIKMADLLHNLETLEALPEERKKRWIKELKESYLPFFSDYYHKISFHYHEVYNKLIEKLQELIHKYDVKNTRL